MSDHRDHAVADRQDLRRRVRAALTASAVFAEMTPDLTGDQARLALDLAAAFAQHRDAFEGFVADHDVSFEEWMWNLPTTIAAAGLPDRAVAAADALGGIDTANQRTYAGDAATILARAGRADQAQGRVNANIARWRDDPGYGYKPARRPRPWTLPTRRRPDATKRYASPNKAATPTRSPSPTTPSPNT